MTRAVSPRRPRTTRDAYGLAPVGALAPPILALVGLVVLAVATLNLMGGSVPLPGTVGPGGNNAGGPVRTPAPSNEVIVDPLTEVPGAIVYAKAGNIWIQSGTAARQLSTNGTASMPTWSPDGRFVYYIDTFEERATFPQQGVDRKYVLTSPRLMRIAADGSGRPEVVRTGRFRDGPYRWFYWLRQPAISPNGRLVALTSDQPDPQASDVVVQLYDLRTGQFNRPDLPVVAHLGHQDPAWHPSGRYLLYVRNGRDGSRGAPSIVRWDRTEQRVRTMTGPGYNQPEYSPDGRYIVATRTDGFGTNVVILDGSRGGELIRLTNDGRSWAPVWSPRGDAIAFLHIEAGIVDLRMIPLDGAAPNWTLGAPLDLTQVSGLDGASGPDWFIPADQVPAPSTPPSAPPASQ
jgi:Tol biopolymer transport system component